MPDYAKVLTVDSAPGTIDSLDRYSLPSAQIFLHRYNQMAKKALLV